MATYTKVLLSGSTDGKPIHITASGTPGNTVHTAITGTSSIDEIWLYAQNKATSLVSLTVEYGDSASIVAAGVTSQDGLHLIIPGLIINNSEIVRVFANTSGIDIYGFVNRIT